MARCSRATALPASSTCSRRHMAASARRSRARRIASISTSSAPGSASGSRRWASRSSSIPASAATTPLSTPFATFSARRPFTPAEVDKIVVHGSQVTVDHVGWPYRPEGLTSAQLNLPFAVATLLLEGDVFVDQFGPDAVADARAHRALAQGRRGPRPRHHRAGFGIPAQGAGGGPIPRRLTRDRDPGSSARQRTVVRHARTRSSTSSESSRAAR